MYLPIYLSIYLSICLSVCPSVCLSVDLSIIYASSLPMPSIYSFALLVDPSNTIIHLFTSRHRWGGTTLRRCAAWPFWRLGASWYGSCSQVIGWTTSLWPLMPVGLAGNNMKGGFRIMNHAKLRGEGTQWRTDYTCVLSYMKCDVACAVRESGESAERASGAARVLRGAVDF